MVGMWPVSQEFETPALKISILTTSSTSSYLLPFILRNGLELVAGHELLQHFGYHDKLAFVFAHLHPEEQSCDVYHIISAADMIASQVLWQLLQNINFKSSICVFRFSVQY